MSKERRYQNEEIREILELAGRDDVAQPESAPTADGLPKYILQQRWRTFVSSALFAAGALGSRHIAGPIAAAERLNSPSANCNLGILMKAACLLLAVVGMALNSAPALSQDKPAVAMIGTGTLAETLGPALGARGYPVIYGSRDPLASPYGHLLRAAVQEPRPLLSVRRPHRRGLSFWRYLVKWWRK
jgi:hypothetical protein